MSVFINPGSEPVNDTKEAEAYINVQHLLTDVGIERVRIIRLPEDDEDDGRYTYLLLREMYNQDYACSHVQMPGLPLEQVRYMDPTRQDAWEFPRLFIDHSSWLWRYAIHCVQQDLADFDKGEYLDWKKEQEAAEQASDNGDEG